jgi:hypothetical protein
MTDADADADADIDPRPPFFPRGAHVVIGVLLAIACVAGIVNAAHAGSTGARVVHIGIAAGCLVWSVIELGFGGRPRP